MEMNFSWRVDSLLTRKPKTTEDWRLRLPAVLTPNI